MPLELITVPCLEDNYAFIIGNPETRECAIIDVPEAGPLNAAVAKAGWTLTTVLLTHHHWDHIDGLDGLTGKPKVIGAKADAHRLPSLDTAVSEGDVMDVLGEPMNVIDVSGHTVGHVAFHFPQSALVFTADSLMALGCGRLFEGTPAQMWASMKKLAALPAETTVCSGHEYTTGNAAFALSVDPDNLALKARAAQIKKDRAANKPTVPSSLSLELATNPFLRADDDAIKAHLGMQGIDGEQIFTEIRARKDSF